jgi:superfamily I DNA/RNA helicase
MLTDEKCLDVVIGSAGSGKTRFLCEELTRLKREMHLEPEQIAMCTFTRTGRSEIAGRLSEQWGCAVERLTREEGNFKTAHALAYRETGVEKGQLLAGGKESEDWLRDRVGSYEQTADAIEVWGAARNRGSSLRAACRRLEMAGGRPPDFGLCLDIIKRYEIAKKREGRLDFHDVIGRFAGVRFSIDGGYEEVIPMGTLPQISVLAVDEAQDSSVLVDRVCKRLASAESVQHVILCGDPFQSIHGFAGGDYRLFLGWTQEHRIMPRSYRCPPEIHKFGERCLQRMKSGYFDRRVVPAEHEGDILRVSSFAEGLANRTEGSCLVLARCQYAVNAYQSELSSRGIPHCYIDRKGADKTNSAWEALHRIESGRPMRASDWRNAVGFLSSSLKGEKCLERGCKTSWERHGRWQDLTTVDLIGPTDEYLRRAGCTDYLIAAIRRGDWPEFLTRGNRDRASRWRRIAKSHGPDQASNPSTRLSTIHGAKGCEADTVIVSARSTSTIGRSCVADTECHDEECRVAYVAATRAKKRLVIVEDYDSAYRMPL